MYGISNPLAADRGNHPPSLNSESPNLSLKHLYFTVETWEPVSTRKSISTWSNLTFTTGRPPTVLLKRSEDDSPRSLGEPPGVCPASVGLSTVRVKSLTLVRWGVHHNHMVAEFALEHTLQATYMGLTGHTAVRLLAEWELQYQ